ncbi:MAG: carboxypeptidase M32, partial [Novibacillus thermophilus]
QLKSVDLDAFYRGINVVKPSLIRIEADELTYALHIMVRYEIEKGLINEEIRVSDLPEIWNDKMQEYLGVVPSHDGEGVLQDVHWSGGSFGYFPSYALGYIYAAQFLHKLGKDLPDYERSVAEGDLSPVKAWLAEHIHRHGAMYDPRDLLRRVTGEDLDARHLVAYLEQKYRDVYRIPNEDSEG